jgi:hypothetical protein
MKPMGRESGAQGGGTEAPHISSLPRSFEPVDHNDVSGRPVEFLGLNQHLNSRVGLVQALYKRELRLGAIPGPQVRGNSLDVGIAKERIESNHSDRGL